jgi:hypothetical protein
MAAEGAGARSKLALLLQRASSATDCNFLSSLISEGYRLKPDPGPRWSSYHGRVMSGTG